jgi:glutamine amidotransferase
MVIIDYGVGNLRSIEKAFAATGTATVISDDKGLMREATALVLPGVGAFGACMKALGNRGFDDLISERTAAGIPLLGVCVGMQMLFEESDEFGKTKGLGLLRGSVRRFDHDLVVPHVGWNQVKLKRKHKVVDGIEDGAFFYFVHSYFCEVEDRDVVLGETEYGHVYTSMVVKENIAGVQFHPEKSQTAGLQLLNNFAGFARCGGRS